MKKYFSIFMLLLISTISYSQLISVSVGEAQWCNFNKITKQLTDCDYSYDKSLFKVNKDASIITHVTENMTSSYYVVRWEKSDYNDRSFDFEVKSDVGNHYLFRINAEDMLFTVINLADIDKVNIRSTSYKIITIF